MNVFAEVESKFVLRFRVQPVVEMNVVAELHALRNNAVTAPSRRGSEELWFDGAYVIPESEIALFAVYLDAPELCGVLGPHSAARFVNERLLPHCFR